MAAMRQCEVLIRDKEILKWFGGTRTVYGNYEHPFFFFFFF